MLSHWKLQWVNPSWRPSTHPPTGGGENRRSEAEKTHGPR